MKTRTTLFATTALVATLAAAGAAFAHSDMGRGMGQGMGPGTGMGMSHGMGMGPSMHGAPAATNLADVKTTLKITAEQDAAWAAYAAVVTRHTDARNNLHEKMQALHADPKATSPDRSAMQETMLKFRQDMQAQRTAALKDLYAVLTPEQKTLADQNLGGMGGTGGQPSQGMAGRMGHGVGHHRGGQGGMGMGGH